MDAELIFYLIIFIIYFGYSIYKTIKGETTKKQAPPADWDTHGPTIEDILGEYLEPKPDPDEEYEEEEIPEWKTEQPAQPKPAPVIKETPRPATQQTQISMKELYEQQKKERSKNVIKREEKEVVKDNKYSEQKGVKGLPFKFNIRDAVLYDIILNTKYKH